MSRKSISILSFILISSFLSFAQETEKKVVLNDEIVHIVYISSFYDEKTGISELKNQPNNILKFCLSDSNKVEEKICNALDQFAKEENIKIILNADKLKATDYMGHTEWHKFIDVTKEFIEYYNTHFAKKKK